MNSAVKITAAALLAICIWPGRSAAESQFSASLHLLLGQRTMSHSYWSNRGAESMPVAGVDAYLGTRSGGLLLGISNAGEGDVSINQIDIGGRTFLGSSPLFRPYFSLGVSAFSVEAGSHNEEMAGYFANLGALFYLGPVSAGADLRYVFMADGNVGGTSVTLNHLQLALTLGFGN